SHGDASEVWISSRTRRCGMALGAPASAPAAASRCSGGVRTPAIAVASARLSDDRHPRDLAATRRVLPAARQFAAAASHRPGMALRMYGVEGGGWGSAFCLGAALRMTSAVDAIIVGSGASGVNAAYPLVEAGLRVTMLDVGLEDLDYER